jgi:hypothetical protein
VSSNEKNNKFNIGDLVLYAPYYLDGDGSWMMSGDLGIVVSVKNINESGYEIVKVIWIDSDLDSVDMHCEVLKKITGDDFHKEKI